MFDMSVSLDGFVTAADMRADEPVCVGGQVLHGWAMVADPADAEALAAGADRLGALITGRRTYDAVVPMRASVVDRQRVRVVRKTA